MGPVNRSTRTSSAVWGFPALSTNPSIIWIGGPHRSRFLKASLAGLLGYCEERRENVALPAQTSGSYLIYRRGESPANAAAL